MTVQFNVSNDGLGEPFHYWWRDRVVSKEYDGIFDWKNGQNYLKLKSFQVVFSYIMSPRFLSCDS